MVGLVRTRERHLVRGFGAAAARDLELCARDVELRAARRPGAVKPEVLGTQQVVAGLDAAGDGRREGGLV